MTSTSEIEIENFPSLTHAEVKAMFDSGTFSRGESYVRRGMLSRSTRRGAVIAAVSAGSSGGPYDVRATLATSGRTKIIDTRCSCPIGAYCKHVVALLLTWAGEPEAFVVRPTIADLLAGQERDDLIAIIEKLADLHPFIEHAIEQAIPKPPRVIAAAEPGSAAAVTVKIAEIRKQLHAAIDAIRDDPVDDYDEYDRWDYHERDPQGWGFGEEEVDGHALFAETVALAEEYEQAGRLGDAVMIDAAAITIGTERYEETFDSSEIIEQLHAAGRGLVRCLEREATLPSEDRFERATRETLIDAFVELWLFIGDGYWDDPEGSRSDTIAALFSGAQPLRPAGRDVTPVVTAALTPDELRALDRRWRQEAANANNGETRQRSAIELGLALNGPERMPINEVLNLMTAAGLLEDQIRLLLSLGRLPEAIAAARRLSTPAKITTFANDLWKASDEGPNLALRFVDDLLWESDGKNPQQETAYLGWMASAHERLGQTGEAIETRLRLFKLQPGLQGVTELKRLITHDPAQAARWPAVRESLIQTLSAQKRLGDVMEIYLREGDATAALALFEQEEHRPRKSGTFDYWGNPLNSYRARIAAIAEEEFPDFSLRVYQQLAEQQISLRSRSEYAIAAGHLAAVKRLLADHGRAAEWPPLIAKIRTDYKSLRALQEELTRAGAV